MEVGSDDVAATWNDWDHNSPVRKKEKVDDSGSLVTLNRWKKKKVIKILDELEDGEGQSYEHFRIVVDKDSCQWE